MPARASGNRPGHSPLGLQNLEAAFNGLVGGPLEQVLVDGELLCNFDTGYNNRAIGFVGPKLDLASDLQFLKH